VERLVLALSNEGDIVLDPFMGVGTTVIAALLHSRRGIGVDKERVYVEIALQRVQEALQGTLKRRPLGKPKYQPTGREKVAQTPPEWRQSEDGE
jgi:adenine-specific DNA-methyltransferase